MATERDEFEQEDEASLRENSIIIDKIGTILQRIVDTLKDTESDSEIQGIFACKEMPTISFKDFLKRYQTYGEINANSLLAALIYTDRALRSRFFTKKSTIHK